MTAEEILDGLLKTFPGLHPQSGAPLNRAQLHSELVVLLGSYDRIDDYAPTVDEVNLARCISLALKGKCAAKRMRGSAEGHDEEVLTLTELEKFAKLFEEMATTIEFASEVASKRGLTR